MKHTSLPLHLLIAAAATLFAAPALAVDGVCDPHAADAANDPDCTQGPSCDYADTAGTAETCDHADTCDTATTCEYADNCGDAETCAVAESCTTADHATSCDTATYADTCGAATTADVALAVGECVTGVFSVGGGASPDCGDLRYDGQLGINTDPTAALDVAGTVALRGALGGTGLQVAPDGKVGIGTDTPGEALDVIGTIQADRFVVPTRVKKAVVFPLTDCRSDYMRANIDDGFLRHFSDEVVCAVQLKADVVITGVSCAGDDEVDVSLIQRDGGFNTVGTWSVTGDLGGSLDMVVAQAPPIAEGGSATLILTPTYNATLFGCQVSYEDSSWN